MVIGGVMSDSTTNTETGIPFLSSIPFLGNLFKSVSKETSLVETVIFVKATIVRPDDFVNSYDRQIHDTASPGAKPFFR